MDQENKSVETDESVGYGNPPSRSRFKKGQSGNPKGRPKGSFNVATVLAKTLREKVVINENGKRKVISKLEAACKQLLNKAASGELKALQLLTALARSIEEPDTRAPVSSPALDEADEKVFQGILKRLEIASKGDEKNENKPDSDAE